MVKQTTEDGITVEQIDATYEVLEVIRESLSEDGMGNLAEIANEAHYLVQQYDEGARWGPRFDLPEPGDVLIDPESNPKYGSGRVEVVDVPGTPAHSEYVAGRSVASHNPGHPSDATVVRARYVDGSERVYHFPVTRLEDQS